MGLKVLKVESIPCVPDCPRRDCPPLQLLLVEFQLHLSKEDEKICSYVVALLCSTLKHSPHVSCQWALPQNVTHRFRLIWQISQCGPTFTRRQWRLYLIGRQIEHTLQKNLRTFGGMLRD